MTHDCPRGVRSGFDEPAFHKLECLSVGLGDLVGFAATEAVLAMTGMPPEVDVARLEVELGRLLALYRRSQSTGGGLEELMQRLLTLVRDDRLNTDDLRGLIALLGRTFAPRRVATFASG